MDIKIDSNIPAPAAKSTGKKYPLSSMEVGDSFFVPITLENRNLRAVIAVLAKRNEITATSRTVVEDGVKGIRFWRTA